MSEVITNEKVDDFDLNSIFMDGDDPVGTEDIFECDKPHWRVSREDFRKVLQIVSSFPSKSTVFLAVWQEGSNLCVHANNRDAYVDVKLSIQNDKYYDSSKVYFLDTDKLLAFVNAYKQFVFSFDEDGTIYFESPYVRYKLDTLRVSLEEVVIKNNVEDLDWVKFPLTKSQVGVFKTLYGFAIKLSDSKVLVENDKIEAFYTLYKYSVFGNNKVKDKVIIRRLDLPTIHEIVDDDLMFSFTKERLFFKFGLGVVSFLRVSYDEASFMYPESFATGKELGKFSFDIPVIKKALKLIALFNANEVDFFSEGTDIFMGVTDKAKFKVGSEDFGTTFYLEFDTFSKLLGTIDDNEGSVSVCVTEHGIDFTFGNLTMYSLSRVSINQIKRKDKDAMRLGTQTTSSVTPGASVSTGPSLQAPVAEFQDKEIF